MDEIDKKERKRVRVPQGGILLEFGPSAPAHHEIGPHGRARASVWRDTAGSA